MLKKKDFITIFTDRAGEFSDKAAIVDLDGTRETTYRELDALSGRICTALKKGGVKKGDAVIVCMDRKMEYIAAELAVLKCGAAFVALLPEYPASRIQYIKDDCQAELVIDEEFVRKALKEEISDAAEVSLSDPAFLIYTSGSTGNPKGIIHSHKSLTASVIRHEKSFESTAEDVQLSNSPFSFIAMCVDIYTADRPMSVAGRLCAGSASMTWAATISTRCPADSFREPASAAA